MKTHPTDMKLFFPDACWRPDMISGATFLYFHKEAIAIPLHPSVSTFATGCNPFEFFAFVDDRAPEWRSKFQEFLRYWNIYREGIAHTSDILNPLHGDRLKKIMFSYNRGQDGWSAAEDLIASSSLPFSEVTKLIDPFSAADELFSHIFFEKFLEIYESHRTTEELIALGAEWAKSRALIEIKHYDLAGSKIEYPLGLQVSNTNAYCVTIPNECESLAIGPICNDLTLHDHVAGLHIDLVKVAEWSWPVLDDVGDSVNRLSKIYLLSNLVDHNRPA